MKKVDGSSLIEYTHTANELSYPLKGETRMKETRIIKGKFPKPKSLFGYVVAVIPYALFMFITGYTIAGVWGGSR